MALAINVWRVLYDVTSHHNIYQSRYAEYRLSGECVMGLLFDRNGDRGEGREGDAETTRDAMRVNVSARVCICV